MPHKSTKLKHLTSGFKYYNDIFDNRVNQEFHQGTDHRNHPRLSHSRVWHLPNIFCQKQHVNEASEAIRQRKDRYQNEECKECLKEDNAKQLHNQGQHALAESLRFINFSYAANGAAAICEVPVHKQYV